MSAGLRAQILSNLLKQRLARPGKMKRSHLFTAYQGKLWINEIDTS